MARRAVEPGLRWSGPPRAVHCESLCKAPDAAAERPPRLAAMASTMTNPFPPPISIDHWPDAILGLPPGRYIVRVPVARLLSDQDLRLTVHIVRGQGDGPVLGLLAGIHGDETPGARI